MPTRDLLLTALIAVYASIQFSGCSLINFTIGAVIDGVSTDEYVFTASGVDSITRGSSVEVLRVDSSIVSGDFQGKGFAASEEYAVQYEQFINSLPTGTAWPALGDSISIDVKHGALGRKTLSGALLGFGTGVIRVELPGWDEPAAVLVEAVDTIRYNNSFVDGDVLRNLMSAGLVPFRSTIVTITTKHGSQAIQLSEILEVRQPNPNYAKWIGLGVGAVVDIISLATFSFTLGH